MAASGSMFLNASIIMMPVVIIILLINVSIGIITRSAPQLNLFSFGFPMTMLGTFIVLYLSIRNFGFAFSDLIDTSLDHLMTTIESLKMAEENQDGQEKTEEPSQRKIDKA